MMAKKPCPGVIDPLEIESFEQAKNAIGNFVLKSDPENIPIEKSPDKSTIAKYSELKELRAEIQQMKRKFNGQVYAARQQKIDLCAYVQQQLKKLQTIQSEIPNDQIKTVEIIPSMDHNVELLDKKFEMALSIINGHTSISSQTKSTDEEENLIIDFYQGILQMDKCKYFRISFSCFNFCLPHSDAIQIERNRSGIASPPTNLEIVRTEYDY